MCLCINKVSIDELITKLDTLRPSILAVSTILPSSGFDTDTGKNKIFKNETGKEPFPSINGHYGVQLQ